MNIQDNETVGERENHFSIYWYFRIWKKIWKTADASKLSNDAKQEIEVEDKDVIYTFV